MWTFLILDWIIKDNDKPIIPPVQPKIKYNILISLWEAVVIQRET